MSGKTTKLALTKTTRPPQSRAGRQGPYLKSLDHLAKDRINPRKVKFYRRMDQRTNGRTKQGLESCSMRLKKFRLRFFFGSGPRGADDL